MLCKFPSMRLVRNPLKYSKISGLSFLFLSVLFPPTLSAQSTPSIFNKFSIAGYGTLGYAWLNDDNAEYRTGEGESGATNAGSFAVDSRLALQLDGTFNSYLSASAQVIARQNEAGDPGAELEWGFLGIQAADRVVVRLGRMSLPAFSISDFREVGYANVLLRPPGRCVLSGTVTSVKRCRCYCGISVARHAGYVSAGWWSG